MYKQALKQRKFYIENFGWYRWSMLDYYKILGCVVWFWTQPTEPVVCSACGASPIVYEDAPKSWFIYCGVCDNSNDYDAVPRSKIKAIKRWNDMNLGTVCEMKKDRHD